MLGKRNKESLKWYVVLSCLLIGISVAAYFIQIVIFHRPEDTFFSLLQDIAFVPIQVLLVTFIIARLLNEREKLALLKKLNMLIGAFYSEVGTHLMKSCSDFSSDLSELAPHLLVADSWTHKDFASATKQIRTVDLRTDSRRNDLKKLKRFLEDKRGFLLSLLANPNLLEHDTFTDLLWAVFHLMEELASRPALEGLPQTDYDHLTGDINRAYTQLLSEWLSYMEHLKGDYPYLFSLALRTNPMDAKASPVIRE
ncbi:MAG: hypothetical protein ACHQ0Y_12830 [Thermodesulfovibrionales bacterium]